MALACSKVVTTGPVVTRDSMVANEDVLVHAINEIGSRVGVDTNYHHLKALYDMMKIPIDGA